MARRMLWILVLVMLAASALAEEASAPSSLRECTTFEEAEAFLLYPPEEGIAGVEAGYIRLIAQHRAGDDAFRDAYWQGGEPGSVLDLTLQKSSTGRDYAYHAGNMCTRAVYSMALSYLGVDVTPGAMSAMVGQRDLNPPYSEVSELVGVERVVPKAHVFNTMVENYLTDPSYSPVYVYLRRPDGKTHALLIIGVIPDTGRYIVLDPSGMWANGVQYRIYMMSFNKSRRQVLNSTFRKEYAGSEILALYQWRLIPQEESEP
ncbi:MAG: hypothetical protein IKK57_08055 [Clostridia bacterium]|nr:hypothetical protein [Clostridia bacterium]